MSEPQTFSHFQIWRARLQSLEIRTKDVAACSAVILGCIAAGLFGLRLPEHKAYHRGVVRYVGVRHGVKSAGARVLVELPSGRKVFLDTNGYVAGLKEGAAICVHELQDSIRGTISYANALPNRCITPAAH